MDRRTGEIAPLFEFEKRKLDKKYLVPIGSNGSYPHMMRPIDPRNLSAHVRKMVEKTGHGMVSRNSKCPRGSGKRFKRCCMMVE